MENVKQSFYDKSRLWWNKWHQNGRETFFIALVEHLYMYIILKSPLQNPTHKNEICLHVKKNLSFIFNVIFIHIWGNIHKIHKKKLISYD